MSATTTAERAGHFGFRLAWGWLALVVVLAIVAPWLGHEVALEVVPGRAHLGPGPGHWLGTDHLGRDIYWRVLLACRSFALPGLLACAVASGLGVPAGALAGWRGGLADAAMRYLFMVLGAIPVFVLVLLATSIYGTSLVLLAVVAGVSFAPVMGEAVRSRIEDLRRADYVLANRAHGLPEWRILVVHLMWAASRRQIARHLVTLFGTFLVLETTLSYLDLGVSEPTPSWGNMLSFAWGRADNVWAFLGPALALWLTAWACASLARRLGEERRV